MELIILDLELCVPDDRTKKTFNSVIWSPDQSRSDPSNNLISFPFFISY